MGALSAVLLGFLDVELRDFDTDRIVGRLNFKQLAAKLCSLNEGVGEAKEAYPLATKAKVGVLRGVAVCQRDSRHRRKYRVRNVVSEMASALISDYEPVRGSQRAQRGIR